MLILYIISHVDIVTVEDIYIFYTVIQFLHILQNFLV